eukprot:Seg593.3 transcript_id=Seg593.3/GoldUCD/mRNA.D3Y31 product="Endothelial differentiation-related factor 1" protein_id=Seg593.3/GoldUCD/D3Y31
MSYARSRHWKEAVPMTSFVNHSKEAKKEKTTRWERRTERSFHQKKEKENQFEKMADWDEVTYLKKKPMTAKDARSKDAINAAMRKGAGVDTEKKYAAGGNKQHTAAKDTAKLDRETEDFHHQTVSLDVGKLIQKIRMEKEWTQKDLATRINEKPQVINDYEAGRAIPNNQIMNKLERALGVRLRGKDKGKPMQPKAKK